MVLQRDQVRFSKNTLMANRCFSNDNYRQCECALSMSYRVLLKSILEGSFLMMRVMSQKLAVKLLKSKHT